MSTNELAQRYYLAINKLAARWKNFFAGWQLGERPKDDPECQAVKDHREVTILLRTEASALIKLFIEKGIFTEGEFQQAVIEEAESLGKQYEERFPGVQAMDIALKFDDRRKP